MTTHDHISFCCLHVSVVRTNQVQTLKWLDWKNWYKINVHFPGKEFWYPRSQSKTLFISFSIFHKQKFALLAIFCMKINKILLTSGWVTHSRCNDEGLNILWQKQNIV